MKLTDPTDYQILGTLEEHGRNTGQNLALLMDRDRSYLNAQLTKLAGAGLLRKIGPAKNSGLYEITEEGKQVYQYWETYGAYEGNHQELLE